jgi:5'(3')-deoxyribonucleotidase
MVDDGSRNEKRIQSVIDTYIRNSVLFQTHCITFTGKWEINENIHTNFMSLEEIGQTLISLSLDEDLEIKGIW